jgi:rhamnogalacturonan endolyase
MKMTRREMIQGTLAAVPAMAIAPMAYSAAAVDGRTEVGPALLKDDFSKLRAGWLTFPVGVQNTAIQENQWVAARADEFGGVWSNGVADQDAWLASMEMADEKPFVMQQLYHPPHGVSAVLVAGKDQWADYTYQAKVRPLSFDGVAGIAFRYQSNLQYYVLALAGGDTVQINVQHLITEKFRQPNWETVASAPFKYSTDEYYLLKVENQGATIPAFVNNSKVLEVSNAVYAGGKIGLSANIPARFQDVLVEADAAASSAIQDRIHKFEIAIAKLQADNPQPRLWRKFSTDPYGAASQVRFGDLDGDGELEMLLAQNIQTDNGFTIDMSGVRERKRKMGERPE